MTARLIAAYLGWLLAAAALALLFGVLAGEFLALTGIVGSLSEGQRRVVEIAAVACFVVLAVLPFVLRRRIQRSDRETTT